MRHSSATCLAAALLLAAAPVSAAPVSKAEEAARTVRAAPVAASAPGVRLAAYITTSLISSDNCAATVVRGKGVASVTATGTTGFQCNIICIKPSVKLNLGTIVPVVSAEYTNLPFDINVVQWRTSGVGCPAGTIDVITFGKNFGDPDFGFASSAAFTIVVP